MSCVNNFGDINETFIIEPMFVGTDVVSACTAIYTNLVNSCSGDTSIELSNGNLFFRGNINTNNNVSGNTFYVNDVVYVNQISSRVSSGPSIDMTESKIVINGNIETNNNNISASTIDAHIFLSAGTNLNTLFARYGIELTGGTFNNTTKVLTLTNANGGSITINGFTDYYTTGVTFVNNLLTIRRNDGQNVSTQINNFTGLTVGSLTITGNTSLKGLTATTISATTYLNLPVDNFTGGTVNGATNFTNGLTATTISATTYLNLPQDIYVTGLTFDTSNYNLTITRNDGWSETKSLSILSSDLTVTGGTYNSNTGVATFTNNTGGTFNVSGFTSGLTDTIITNFTYSSNTFTINDSSGRTFNVLFNTVTGLTINGNLAVTGNTSLQGLSASTISATTYQNLPNNIYTGNDTLISNRTINLSSYTLNFSSATQSNTLSLSSGNVGIGKIPSYKLDVNGDINFPTTTGSTYGVINQNGNRVLHTYGTTNLFLGSNSGNFTMTGFGNNIGIGANTLQNNVGGTNNIAIGIDSLKSNTNGNSSVAIGVGALSNNLISQNVAVGYSSLNLNTSGYQNVAIGYASLGANLTGIGNVAVGFATFYNNITGSSNVGIGNYAGFNETSSNKLYIANNQNSTLIYGEFDNGRIGINTTAATHALTVNATSNPLRLINVQTSNDPELLTINSTGVVSKIALSAANITVSSLTITTISATTYQNLPQYLSGVTQPSANTLTITNSTGGTFNYTPNAVTGGSYNSTAGVISLSGTGTLGSITGITLTAATLYNSNGTLSGNRVVNLSGNTLNFSSATQPNTLSLSSGNVGIGKTPSYKLDVNGDINLPATTGSTYGVIRQNGNRILHTYGTNNLFLGSNSGNFTMTGSGSNIGIGTSTLQSNVDGIVNIAIGIDSLTNNTLGDANLAIGSYALYNNTTGNNNIAIGINAINNNKSQSNNLAIGYNALKSITSGTINIAIGNFSLQNSLEVGSNIGIGYESLFLNKIGGGNLAIGNSSLRSNLDLNNIAIGNNALTNHTYGAYNIAIGIDSLYNKISGDSNTTIGFRSLYNNITGSSNVTIGYNAGYNETGSNKLYIANSENSTLIYGEFDNGRVGINTTAATHTLTVNAASDPLKLINVQTSTDSEFLTIDGSGVVHKKTITIPPTVFLRNQSNPSSTDTIEVNGSIFNPSNLEVLNGSTFIISANADYYILGDLINYGTIEVYGTLKVGGGIYNYSSILVYGGTIE